MGFLFWLCILFVLYAYAGYPLLVAALARLRPARAPGELAGERPLPSLTLLIAAYNEAGVIRAKLENSLSLDYPRDRLQILVAADGSDDDTPIIVDKFRILGVELSYQPQRRGKMAAIGRAMPRVRGEIVVLSDANNMYDPTALRELARAFDDPTVGAATGAKVIAKDDGHLGDSEGLYWKYESFIKRMETRLGNCVAVAGEILALRRRLVKMLPASVINDDFLLAMLVLRSGLRVVYVPRAVSRERVSPTVRDEIVRRKRIVAGRWQAMALSVRLLLARRPFVFWQILSHKFTRPFVPAAMLLALVANAAALLTAAPGAPASWLALTGWCGWFLLAAQGAFYALAAFGEIIPKSWGKLGKLLYLPRFVVAGNWAAVTGFGTFLLGRQNHLWTKVSRRA